MYCSAYEMKEETGIYCDITPVNGQGPCNKQLYTDVTG
jgi:hypothetical protein